MRFWESTELSDRLREEFWRRVVDLETAPTTTLFKQVTRGALELPEVIESTSYGTPALKVTSSSLGAPLT